MIDHHFKRLAVAVEWARRDESRKRWKFTFMLFMAAMLLLFFAIGPQNIATHISDFIISTVEGAGGDTL